MKEMLQFTEIDNNFMKEIFVICYLELCNSFTPASFSLFFKCFVELPTLFVAGAHYFDQLGKWIVKEKSGRIDENSQVKEKLTSTGFGHW